MSNFLNNLDASAKSAMLSKMKTSLEATQQSMSEVQKSKFDNGVINAVVKAGKCVLAGGSVAAMGMAAFHGLDAVFAAAEQSMSTGQYAVDAAFAAKAALKSALGYGLVAGSLAVGAYSVHKRVELESSSSFDYAEDHPISILNEAIQNAGGAKVLSSPEKYSLEQVESVVEACIGHLSSDPETLEFALGWGNTLQTKQQDNKMRFV